MGNQLRRVYDTNGNDVTSTVQTFLQSNRTIYQCDLLRISTWVWWMANANWGDGVGSPMCSQYVDLCMTFGDFPVDLGHAQSGPNLVSVLRKYGPTSQSNDIPRNDFATFWPAAIKRDKLDYDIGLTSKTTQITWYCGNSLLPFPVQSIDAPWWSNSGLNTGYPITYNSNGPGTSTSAMIQVSPGGRLNILCIGGAATASGLDGSTNFNDANGAPGGGDQFWPKQQGCVVGAFTDINNSLVAPPFFVGNGNTVNVPAGAAFLQLGFNDSNIKDNFGCFLFTVSGSGVIASGKFPSWQQAFSAGMFDECPAYIYRAFFNGDPKQGGTLLGTTLMFRGFVREAESGQDHVLLTLSSLLDVFQEVQVPTQIIQPGNRTTPYVPSGVTYTVNGMNVGLSTSAILAFNNTLSSPPADHALTDAYIITGGVTSFSPVNGQPQPAFLRVRDNVTAAGVLYIYLYEPTIIPLDKLANEWRFLGGGTNWSEQATTVAILLQKPLSNSYGAPGFPSVPPPEIGI